MIHPLFRLAAAEPQMVAEHLGGYCELLGDELRELGNGWTHRLVLRVAAVGLLAVAIALAGVALMLWAATPPGAVHAPWALLVAPLAPLVAAVFCWLAAPGGEPGEGFAALRRQFAADAQLLREAQSA